MKAFKDSIFGSLRYFQRKSNEINITNLIYIEENVPFDLFEAFILSTSSDELDINDSNYEKFYYFACKYEYQELKDEIEKFINIMSSSINNCCFSHGFMVKFFFNLK